MEQIVLDSIQKTLGRKLDSGQTDVYLAGHLGLDSIDMLDILYGIGKSVGAELQLADLAASLRGELTEDQFQDENGAIREPGLDRLKALFPQASIRSGMNVRHLYELLTVGDLVRIIERVTDRNREIVS